MSRLSTLNEKPTQLHQRKSAGLEGLLGARRQLDSTYYPYDHVFLKPQKPILLVTLVVLRVAWCFFSLLS